MHSFSETMQYFTDKKWSIHHLQRMEGREAKKRAVDGLALSPLSQKFLSVFGGQIYQHQYEAIRLAKERRNVVLTTSTASGKTLAFQVAALENLAGRPDFRVLALYPTRALAAEQEQRWRDTLRSAGAGEAVGRIDGGVPFSNRIAALKDASVVVATPDIVHAWLLCNIEEPLVFKFFRELGLIILDEAHTYTGVFGSHAAYLLRRVTHAVRRLGGGLQFIAASATMADPARHLEFLTGHSFNLIDETCNSAPRQAVDICMVNPPFGTDILSACSDLMRFIVGRTTHNVIAFVDSRKQSEHIAAISNRSAAAADAEYAKLFGEQFHTLKERQIYPYRSGYEEEDRRDIQDMLSSGRLRGVASTSALELGIDVPHLDLAVLVGVPSSATSLYQRIGRIGRHAPGQVVIINDGSVVSSDVFRDPQTLLELPLAEGALYLENPRVQYIHALCLARQGGEDDTLCAKAGIPAGKEFVPLAECPETFRQLCASERTGEISLEFQTMKAQAGDHPHYVFPLRDVDAQFQVEDKRGPSKYRRGTLSHAQVLREAYPGAVYYYRAQAFRVYRLITSRRLVAVRREKQYTTKPVFRPTQIYPNLTSGNIEINRSFGDLSVVECNLQINSAVIGYRERRGSSEFKVNYPPNEEHNIYFDRQQFSRNYFTTGVILSHPCLSDLGVKPCVISEVVYEAFLLHVAFERRDIGYGDDRFRADRDRFPKDQKFLSVFDQTYGSLRLTSRLHEDDLLRPVLKTALRLAQKDDRFEADDATLRALEKLHLASMEPPVLFQDNAADAVPAEEKVPVILPQSNGVDITKNNEEFFVESVFYSPQLGVAYRGFHESEARRRIGRFQHSNADIIVPARNIVEIHGVSRTGHYDLLTGEIGTD